MRMAGRIGALCGWDLRGGDAQTRRQNRAWRSCFAGGAGGYMTVEASLILPMVLCIYVAIIYAGFYLYNRCVATQDAYVLCYRESLHKDDDLWSYPDGSVARREEAAQVGDKYLAVKSKSASVSTDGAVIRYSGEGNVAPPLFGGGSSIMPQGIWTYRYGMSARHTDPPLNIRKARRVYASLHGIYEAVQSDE